MKGAFIDTHCHLYLPEFKEDLQSVMMRAEEEGISKFYLPAVDNTTHEDMLAVEASYPDKCYAMIGLHPCSVKENYLQELHEVELWLQKRKFVAVGEVGLDFYWDRTFEKEQALAFHQQIEWALEHEIPVVIHSRNAIDECTDIIRKYQSGTLKGVFHCFSGTYEQGMAIVESGMYLGIGGVITYQNAGLSETISKIPIEHIVLETDAPYLAPVPFRGKRNESGYLKYVIEKLAVIKNITSEEVGRITSMNAQKIFDH